MTLNIEFTPQVEAWRNLQAKLRGSRPADVIKNLVDQIQYKDNT